MKGRFAPVVECIAESTTACLVTMVQGNLLALTLGHLLIASQTGVVAGAIASIAILAARINARWIISVLLGAITGVVDFFVHPGQFGPIAMEALVTGLGAALLSYVVGLVARSIRAKYVAKQLSN